MGMTVTVGLLVRYHLKNYSLRKALVAIVVRIFLYLVHLIALIVIGASMIRSVLPPP